MKRSKYIQFYSSRGWICINKAEFPDNPKINQTVKIALSNTEIEFCYDNKMYDGPTWIIISEKVLV